MAGNNNQKASGGPSQGRAAVMKESSRSHPNTATEGRLGANDSVNSAAPEIYDALGITSYIM